jgi:Tol biopolymer transport system component
VLLPTGAGQPRTLDRGSLTDIETVAWFPDGRRVLIAGSEAGGPVRLWIQELAGGAPKSIGPDGFRTAPFSRPISPDGTSAIAIDRSGNIWIHSLTGGSPRRIDGLTPGDHPLRWAADGQSFYFSSQGALPGIVYRLYLADGRKERIASFAPADSAGVRSLASMQTTPDAMFFVYSYSQSLSDLFLLGNVR